MHIFIDIQKIHPWCLSIAQFVITHKIKQLTKIIYVVHVLLIYSMTFYFYLFYLWQNILFIIIIINDKIKYVCFHQNNLILMCFVLIFAADKIDVCFILN